MKKYYKIGVLGAIVAPLATVVACGSAEKNVVVPLNSDIAKLTELNTSQMSKSIVGSSKTKVSDAIAKLPGFKAQSTQQMIDGTPRTSSIIANGKNLKNDKDDSSLFRKPTEFDNYTELDWLKHFANLNTASPSGVSPMYRWKQTVTKSQIKEVIDKTLGNLVQQFIDAQVTSDVETPTNPFGSSKFLLWDKNKKDWTIDLKKITDGSYNWEKHEGNQKSSFIGDIQDIVITNRANSGVVKSIIVVGSKNTIAVASEYQIRFLLRFKKNPSYGINEKHWKEFNQLSVAGGKINTYVPDEEANSLKWVVREHAEDYTPKYNSGQATLFAPIAKIKTIKRTIPGSGYKDGYALLPSGYFSIYNSGNSLTFFGGGYGHGVGMSQYGAAQLGRAGWDAEKIVNHYYKGGMVKDATDATSISKAYKFATVGLTFGAAQQDARKVSTTEIVLKPTPGEHLIYVQNDSQKQDIQFKKDEIITITRTSSGDKFTITGDKNSTETIDAVKVKGDEQGNSDVRKQSSEWGFKSSGSNKSVAIPSLKNVKRWRKYKSASKIGYIGIEKDQNGRPIALSPEYQGYIIPFVSPRNGNNNSFSVANKTPINNYIKYILPSEMISYFGLEALEAQAITARSNFYAEAISDSKGGYGVDVLDSTASQVYNNANIKPNEETLFANAANNTGSKIIVDNTSNNPLQTVYASANSGLSASPNDVWINWAKEPSNLKDLRKGWDK